MPLPDMPPEPIDINDLKIGMVLAMNLHTKDGRLVLGGGTVLNEALLKGIQRLAKGKAIPDHTHILVN